VSATPPPSGLETVPDPRQVVVRLSGDLDVETSSRLQDEVRELRDLGFERIVVDLSRLRLIGPSGLRALIALRNDARREGGSLALVPGPAVVQRVFHLTRTRGLFEWDGEHPLVVPHLPPGPALHQRPPPPAGVEARELGPYSPK
jgi:anti-anti-sigma factor